MRNIARRSALFAFLALIPACLGDSDETTTPPPPNSAVIRFFEATSFTLEMDSTVQVILKVATSDGKALSSEVTVVLEDLGTGSATPAIDYDFSATLPLTVVIPAGTADEQGFAIDLGDILADAIDDPNENIDLGLTAGSGRVTVSSPSAHSLVILESAGSVAFTMGSSSVIEGHSGFPVYLELTTSDGGLLTEAVSIQVAVSPDSTATAGVDYLFTPPDIVFEVGSADGAFANFTIESIIEDGLGDDEETIIFELSSVGSAIGVPRIHTLTITEPGIAAASEPGTWVFNGTGENLQWAGVHPIDSDAMLLLGSDLDGLRVPAVARLNSDGQLAWVSTLDTEMSVLDTAAISANGTHTLAGSRADFLASLASATSYHQSGSVKWMKEYQFAPAEQNPSHSFRGATTFNTDSFFSGAMSSILLRVPGFNSDTFGLIAKADPNGNLLWATILGNIVEGFSCAFESIAMTQAGGLLAVGNASPEITHTDGWLVGLDPSGTTRLVTDKFYNANAAVPGDDYFDRITPLSSNQFLVLGRTLAFEEPLVRQDAWVLLFGADGLIISQARYAGPNGTALSFSESLEANGFYYLSGTMRYLDGTTPSEAVLVCLNPATMAVNWAYSFPGDDPTSLLAMARRSDGDLVMAGAVGAETASWRGWLLRADQMGLAGTDCFGDTGLPLPLDAFSLAVDLNMGITNLYVNGESQLPQLISTSLSPTATTQSWSLVDTCP